MCRADVAPEAAPLLVQVLLECAAELARQEGLPLERVKIGPVDFGPPPGELP